VYFTLDSNQKIWRHQSDGLGVEITFDDLYREKGKDWNDRVWEYNDEGILVEYSTYNPNSKWDWYELGGRWTGYFKLKEGAKGKLGEPGLMTEKAKVGYADLALKKDIDFDFMRKVAEEQAIESYDKAMGIIGELPINESWEVVIARIDDVEEAREIYWNQPRCKAWKDQKGGAILGFSSSPDDFLMTKDEYVQEAKNGAIVTFAVLKDGKWYEKGKMGWWACVTNEKDKKSWNAEFAALIDSLSDDTLLSVYDCHI